MTALVKAAREMNSEKVRNLLGRNQHSLKSLNEALYWASYGNFADIAEQLIRAGANVNEYGNHSLYRAVENKQLNLIKLILTHGGKKNSIDNFDEKLLAML